MKKLPIIITALIFTFLIQITDSAQAVADAMKSEAVKEMQVGRYGEAIDLLNRYISARPQQSDGYNLRGLCYEKRQQYEFAVYDYRSARKLDPNSKEINDNLARATQSWYSLLYNEIEGYKREIAINPKNAESYLAIGVAYKNLGQWPVAEVWYDKYLTLAHASPDEIIRYSEILAKNGHIAKGWPILKRYTEEYPNDQRIWSRFGYFSLWLGKTQIAIEAFESSLALKPYFKEAKDGLDIAKGKGYVFTVNDTSIKYFNYGLPAPRAIFIYPIDKYYSILKRSPSDNDTRLKLLNALIENKRYEEANQQIQVLQGAKYDSLEIANISTQLDSISTVYYQNKINELNVNLASDSSNKANIIELGRNYTRLQDYDSALIVYDNYLNKFPDDPDVQYASAEALASNRDFNRAQEKMTMLLSKDPNNTKYQLFTGQLDVWLGQYLDTAKVLLNNVLAKEPNNIAALVAYSSLDMQKNDFASAQTYVDKIKNLNPSSPEVLSLESTMEIQKSRYKQELNFNILMEGRNLYAKGQCDEALPKYEEFMSKSEPNVLIEKEYADVNVCAGHYQKALNIYDSLLNQNYDYNTDLSRAEAYFYMRDSVNALQAFQSLEKTHPDDYFVNLYLGDSYLRMGEYDKAKSVYERMQDSLKLDSTQNATVALRYGWMPVTGVSGFFSYFPTYALLTPSASYYSDNIGIKNNTQGLRLDLGITTFLSVGVEDYRTTLASNSASVNSNTFRWDITLRLTNLLMFGINFGNTFYNLNNYSQPNVEIFARTEELNHYLLYGTYNRLDASQVIYSQYLVTVRLNADVYRIGGYYQFNSGIKASIDLTDLNFSDGNTGYTAFLRLGKYFYPDFFLGYAYANSGFKATSLLYFSPISYSSHNIFADWDIIKDTTTTLTIGGLIGFPVNTTFILRQGYITGTFRVFDRLTIQGRIVGGSSLQNYVGYSSFYANLTAYWSL